MPTSKISHKRALDIPAVILPVVETRTNDIHWDERSDTSLEVNCLLIWPERLFRACVRTSHQLIYFIGHGRRYNPRPMLMNRHHQFLLKNLFLLAACHIPVNELYVGFSESQEVLSN